MANETFVVTLKEDPVLGAKCAHGYKMLTGSLSFSASYTKSGTYATDGEPMDLSKIFPKDLHVVLFEYQLGYKFEYDYTNKRVHAYVGASGVDAEAGNTDDLFAAGLTDVRFIAIGK